MTGVKALHKLRPLCAVSDPSPRLMLPFLRFIFQMCVQKHTSQRARQILEFRLVHFLIIWEMGADPSVSLEQAPEEGSWVRLCVSSP